MYRFRTMDKAGWEWFNSVLPVHAVDDSGGMVAIGTNDEYVGGCVYDNWTKTSVQCHFLVTNSMVVRTFFNLCANFVFEDQERRAVYSSIPSNNERSLRFFKKVGFQEKCRLKDAYDVGVDSVVVELLRENCWVILKKAA